MISAMSDASTAIVVWEFFPNTSTNILSNDERVCVISSERKTVNTPILVTTTIKVPINHKYGQKTISYDDDS